MTGAVATKLEPVAHSESPSMLKTRRVGPAVQAQLFDASPDSKVVSIARYAPPAAPKQRVKPETGTRTAKTPRKSRPAPEGQGTLDFLPPLPPQARQLGSTVDAVISCEFPVATTSHRAIAAALDWSMVLIGYAGLMGLLRAVGCELTLSKMSLMMYGGMFFVLAFLYGLIFAIAGADTPGMVWTRLRTVTFDGLPPELRQRLGRFLAAGMSRCTLLGLLWSLADEENLTWHDHISSTFPTPRDAETVVRHS
ncbi:MAG TPA: RDD family protein [Candidatus Solibacter sp.]|nr:RDD family protein [Candidatus Solibacter sp.]